jgi:hypothetical protein
VWAGSEKAREGQIAYETYSAKITIDPFNQRNLRRDGPSCRLMAILAMKKIMDRIIAATKYRQAAIMCSVDAGIGLYSQAVRNGINDEA